MITVVLYAHAETDEDSDHLVEEFVEAGVPEDVAHEFINSSPLYEVGFVFEYDDGEFHLARITRVDGRTYTCQPVE